MDFHDLIEDLTSLPALPQAYHRCCYLLEQETTDSNALAAVVGAEPALAISVLRLVNSAFYNMPRKIERLDHAISIIGHRDFKQLILTAAVVRAVRQLANGLVDMDVFWRHSIFTGLVARRLALHSYMANCERLFVAGLLHDIGQLIYFDVKPQKSIQVCELIEKYGIDTIIAEDKVLGFDHQTLGAALCQHWQLPVWLQDTIRHHHAPGQSIDYRAETSVLYLANVIANQYYPGLASQGRNGAVPDPGVNDLARREINLTDGVVESVVKEALEQLDQVLGALVPNAKTAANK